MLPDGSSAAVEVCVPSSMRGCSQGSAFLPSLGVVILPYCGRSHRRLAVVSSCTSLLTQDEEHLFLGLAPSACLLRWVRFGYHDSFSLAKMHGLKKILEQRYQLPARDLPFL